MLFVNIFTISKEVKCILMNEIILPYMQSAPVATNMLLSFRKIYC